MPKKAADLESIALEGLAQALTDPAPRLLISGGQTRGFFKAKGRAQTVRAAARLSEERGWVVGTGEWVGKGDKQSEKYRLTPAGLQAVLSRNEAAVLLRNLAHGLQQQVEQVGAMREQLAAFAEQAQPVAEAVAELAKRLQPPDVEQLVRKLVAAVRTPESPPAPARSPAGTTGETDWFDEVVRLAREQRQRDRYQPPSLPQVYTAIRAKHPALSLGQFHDGLRALRDQGRIRLTPYTRALASIDDPRNALFLDGEVMYYVELP